MKKALNKKGFTLVELMVVVAIMGVLVAIAVPVYNNVTDRAEVAVCQANMRTYDSAIMQWQLANTANDVATLAPADFTATGRLSGFMKDGAAACPTTGAYSLAAGATNNAWTVACSVTAHNVRT